MPELPEVEDAMRRLRDATLGRTLVRVRALHPAQRKSLTAASSRAIAGQRIVGVTRRAKLQLVEFASGHVLEVHFRMTGDWSMTAEGDAPPPHERVRFELDDGSRVSLVDGRALSVLRLHAPGKFVLPDFGPEPLEEDWTAESFAAALAQKRGPIKPVLLDQRVLSGIGNIYASESLWEARIDPRTPARTISKARVARLHVAIREVLRRAPAGRYYERGGSSRAAAEDEAWRVYGKEGEPCRRCAKRIKRIVQAARSTFWCSGCQT
jgi:formamidopyrimidine-DNA glycosylase